MKKIIKISLCLLMMLTLGGCFNKMYKRTAQNDIVCQGCKQVTDINSLLDNVEKTMNSVDGAKLDYTLTNTKKTFKTSVYLISNGNRENWDVSASVTFDDTYMNVYLKDGKIYIVYPHNGANIVLKDKLENVVDETRVTLDSLNASYDSENLDEFLLGDKLAGFEFDKIKENATYLKNSDGSYRVEFSLDGLNWEMDITKDYLFKEIRCNAENFESVLTFEYPNEVTIDYPMGLDFITLNIEETKEVLKVDSFAEVFDEDLKK